MFELGGERLGQSRSREGDSDHRLHLEFGLVEGLEGRVLLEVMVYSCSLYVLKSDCRN